MWFYKITRKRAYLLIVEKSEYGKIVKKELINPYTPEAGKPTFNLGKNKIISATYDYEKNFYNNLDEIILKILKHKKQHYIIETLFADEHKPQDH